ncbi:MAG: lipopolysaccharide biosynthesis protein [Anaerolineae bacterium]|nr:lipopolysaccharide biosynthesis protein [Anaerolineae bacterium]
MTKLSQRAAKGMIWAYSAYLSGRLMTLLSTALLARILLPDDFGVIGFALIVLNFIEVVRSFGVNDALIYHDEALDLTADTAFWINFAVGVAQYGVLFAIAPLLAGLFASPMLTDIVRVMGLAFILEGLGQAHAALLQKDLRFRRRFLPDLVSAVLKGLATIGMALLGLGVWSLALGHLVGVGVRVAALWRLSTWRPRARFSRARARALWQYGVHILLFNLLAVALDQADQMVIGLILGTTQLGYFTVAYKIPELLMANFSLILTRILFPIFSRLKNDTAALTNSFLATTQYTAFVTFGVGFTLFMVAPQLVIFIYGDRWTEAVPLFQVLSLLGIAYTLPWAAGDAVKAIGRPDLQTKLLLVESLYTFPLIWLLGASTGIAAAASFGNLIASLIAAAVRLLIIARLLNFSPRVFIRVFRPPLAASLGLLLALSAWQTVAAQLPLLLYLIGAGIVALVAYGGLLLIVGRRPLLEAWSVGVSLVRQRSVESA